MPKKKDAGAPTGDADGMIVYLEGDAIALGEDTLAAVDADLDLVDRGRVIIGKGVIESVAAAESGTGSRAFADAATFAEALGADRVRIKTKEKTILGDDAYSISITKIKAFDWAHKDDDPKIDYRIKRTEKLDVDDPELDPGLDLDGNLATAAFDVDAVGEDTLVSVDASVVTVEDVLSDVLLTITAAVDSSV
jgi:hypothetical protein